MSPTLFRNDHSPSLRTLRQMVSALHAVVTTAAERFQSPAILALARGALTLELNPWHHLETC
eukprot:4846329-Amphidinium_carterae.1